METDSSHPGIPIYRDIHRKLTDVTTFRKRDRDWFPVGYAAQKLFRCVESLRDVDLLLQDGKFKNNAKKRRKTKLILTPLHSLSEGIRDLLNDLETNPATVKALPPGAQAEIHKLRDCLLLNTQSGKGQLMTLARNKIAAHIDKDLWPHEAREIVEKASPPQVGWWLHTCVSVLADVLKLPVYYWGFHSEEPNVSRVMYNEPLIVTSEIEKNGRVVALLGVHIAKKGPRHQIFDLLKNVVKHSKWMFGPNDSQIRGFSEDEPGSAWAKSLIRLPKEIERNRS